MTAELFSLEEIISLLDCQTYGTAGTDFIREVSIDSRECRPGSLFVALPGSRTDGHEFVADAFEHGASAALVAAEHSRLSRLREAAGQSGNGLLLIVDSPLAALQSLAGSYLERFPELVRIGITGSNGKTTTKELVAAVLSVDAATHWSEGNYNSAIGLPLAAFGIRKEHRYAVFEMAMNQPGHIERLARICRPHHACITNVGTAHIGHIGSKSKIAKEKRAIFSQFDGNQTAYVAESEPYRDQLLAGLRGKAVPFGPEHTRDFVLLSAEGLRGSSVRLGKHDFRLAVPGSHNYMNACCAVAVGRELGISDRSIARGLANARPLFGRSELIDGDVSIYQDCYNANPESMQALFELLESTAWKSGRKIVVLGAMKELGPQSEEAHRAVSRTALRAGADQVIFVGEEFKHALNGSAASGGALWFPRIEELYGTLSSLVRQGDLVILKGSRSSGLERLVPHLQDRKS